MTITFGAWVIPAIITGILLCVMLRPYRGGGDYDFGDIFRLFWLIPISLTWTVYCLVMMVLR